MAEWSVSWHLIPDGTLTIVQFEIGGECAVSTSDAANEAEAVAAKLIARLTGRDEAEVLRGLQADAESRMWFGDVPRPDEPPRPAGGTPMSGREVYGAIRTPVPAPPEFDDEVRFVGTCCACRREGVPLRNVVCMTFRAPESAPGKGWGCVVCAIPSDGAIAVVCDACMTAERPIVDVCAGYARDPERVAAEPLRAIPWSHIRAFHPDVDEEGVDARS